MKDAHSESPKDLLDFLPPLEFIKNFHEVLDKQPPITDPLSVFCDSRNPELFYT